MAISCRLLTITSTSELYTELLPSRHRIQVLYSPEKTGFSFMLLCTERLRCICYHLIPVLSGVQRQYSTERCGLFHAVAWRRALLADSILQSLLVIRWWEKWSRIQSTSDARITPQLQVVFFFKVHDLIICFQSVFKCYEALDD